MSTASTRRIPQLDAVRGIAVLVVIFHNQRSQFPSLHLDRLFASGWMGVDLFFVLSGFLITGILLDTKDADGYFKNFYARRCLRIWPLYFSVLLFMFVVVPVARPSDGRMIFERSSPWWAYPFFLQNFFVATPTQAIGPLSVSWSLAVEEQFYLAWPWIVRYFSRAQLAGFALAVIVLSPAARLLAAPHGFQIYSDTLFRLDGLMAGAALAIFVRSDGFAAKSFLPVAWAALAVTAPLALILDARFPGRWFVFSFSVAASVAFVYVAMFSPILRRAMANRVLIYTGTISYGMYLLHKIPFDFAKALGWDRRAWIALPMLIATYAAASVSWFVLERPFLRLKRFFEPTNERLSGRHRIKGAVEGD